MTSITAEKIISDLMSAQTIQTTYGNKWMSPKDLKEVYDERLIHIEGKIRRLFVKLIEEVLKNSTSIAEVKKGVGEILANKVNLLKNDRLVTFVVHKDLIGELRLPPKKEEVKREKGKRNESDISLPQYLESLSLARSPTATRVAVSEMLKAQPNPEEFIYLSDRQFYITEKALPLVNKLVEERENISRCKNNPVYSVKMPSAADVALISIGWGNSRLQLDGRNRIALKALDVLVKKHPDNLVEYVFKSADRGGEFHLTPKGAAEFHGIINMVEPKRRIPYGLEPVSTLGR